MNFRIILLCLSILSTVSCKQSGFDGGNKKETTPPQPAIEPSPQTSPPLPSGSTVDQIDGTNTSTGFVADAFCVTGEDSPVIFYVFMSKPEAQRCVKQGNSLSCANASKCSNLKLVDCNCYANPNNWDDEEKNCRRFDAGKADAPNATKCSFR